jgi:hypothetical protein
MESKEFSNLLVRKLFIKLTLIHANTKPAPARVNRPCINNYHPKYRAIHAKRPILSANVLLQVQGDLPAAVVPEYTSSTRSGPSSS